MGITIIRFLTVIFIFGFPIIVTLFWGKKIGYNYYVLIILSFSSFAIAYFVSKILDNIINKSFIAHLVNDLNSYMNHNKIIENYSGYITSWKTVLL